MEAFLVVVFLLFTFVVGALTLRGGGKDEEV